MVVQPGTQQSLLKGVACLLHPPPCPPAGCMVTQPSHFASACLSFNPWPLLLASSRCSGSLTRIQAAADAWRVHCLLSCLGWGQELGGRPKKKKKTQKGSKTGRDFWCDCSGPGSFLKVGGKTWEIPEPPSVRLRLRRKRGLYLVD